IVRHRYVRFQEKFLRFLLISAATLAACSTALHAQDPFEMEVYRARTAASGEYELETHLNYTARGSSLPDGTVLPTLRQGRLAFEFTRGLTPSWEVSAYTLAGYTPGSGLEFAGWRLRSKVRAPDAWGLPLRVAIAGELEFADDGYDEDAAALEI